MTAPIGSRRATLDDLDTLIANVQAGLDSYGSFAPARWRAPRVAAERGRFEELLADPSSWALLAEVEGAPAGHVAFFPGRRRDTDEPYHSWRVRQIVPGLAHLWHLFVLPQWWGKGVAPLLHDAAIAEMRARGYTSARLFTPSGQTRARRFYERHGWAASGEEWNSGLALALTEYRRLLSGSGQ